MSLPPRPFTLLFLGLLLAVAVSCAPKKAPAPLDEGKHPDAVWELFLNRAAGRQNVSGFNVDASLHYAGPKTKSRVVLRFWGNLEHPVRLDLSTSLGSTVALWREDAVEFMAYLPDKETAYLHRDGRLGMAAFGINLPFTLRGLALLLNGRFSELLPPRYTTVRKTRDGDFLFTLIPDNSQDQEKDQPRRFSLLLSPDGVPKGMSTLGTDPWSLEFSGSLADFGLPGLPQKIRMQRSSGERAVLFIKNLEQRPTPWPQEKLDLPLPPNTKIMILENSASPAGS